MTENKEMNGVDTKPFFPARPGTMNFEVWGMPVEAYRDFLDFSRQHAGGKMAVAIMTLLELSKTYDWYLELKGKQIELEERLKVVEGEGKKEPMKGLTLSDMRGMKHGQV